MVRTDADLLETCASASPAPPAAAAKAIISKTEEYFLGIEPE
jgi:hypothetical protein